MSKLDQLNKGYALLREEFVAKSQEVFKEVVKELFDKYPKLEKFKWTQYTPYFNDGDECTFGVSCDQPALTYEGQEYESYEYPDDKPEVEQAGEEISALVYKVEEEVLKDLFGDHVEVSATRKGFETEEYSHD